MRLRTLAMTGIATAAYAWAETSAYRVGRHTLGVPAGSPAMSILHISDVHMTLGDHKRHRWLSHLADELGVTPDIAVATGDLIDDNSGINPLTEAFATIKSKFGNFYVLGSHDYFQTTPHGAIRSLAHFYSGSREPHTSRQADDKRLEARLQEVGWKPLTNSAVTLSVGNERIRIAGVDDPFLNRHTTSHIRRQRDDRLAIGLVHAPDMVSEWVLAGFDVVLAGHTHGGQIRLPFVGALVTNCSLPSALAGGAHKVGAGWLHVTPGLGTSKFAPVRFLCRPEATLLSLQPR
jgi:uncharacterized protein